VREGVGCQVTGVRCQVLAFRAWAPEAGLMPICDTRYPMTDPRHLIPDTQNPTPNTQHPIPSPLRPTAAKIVASKFPDFLKVFTDAE
jgi:hypothetical protein